MPKGDQGATPPPVRKRADARRNEQALLDAAAAVFATGGVNAPVREIATKAGVGMGTIYRHFPTRADLVVAVYRHQIQTLVSEAQQSLIAGENPVAALAQWMDRFVDFLVTKHGLAGALRSDDPGLQALHTYFLDQLIPACAALLDAAVKTGNMSGDIDALTLMHATGNLCIGVEASGTTGYDAHRMVALLIAGLQQTPSA